MKNYIYPKAIFVWFIFAVLTVIFGAFRELVFIPFTGFSPNLARTLLLPIALFYIIGITYLFLKRTKEIYTKSDMIKIGVLWFFLTILFEFFFGALVMGNSFNNLIADYNLLAGRTWSLFLICILTSPIIVYKWLLKR